MSIENHVATLVARWNDGHIIGGELWNGLVDLMTSPTNVDAVVQALPEELRAEFVEHLVDISHGEGPLFRGSVCSSQPTAEEEAAIERAWALKNEHWANVLQPAIREWVRKRA